MQPILNEHEPPTGYPEAIDLVSAVVGFNMTGETEASPWPGEDNCSVKGAPCSEPEEVSKLFVDKLVMPARSGR
jgi:hypothetical protein